MDHTITRKDKFGAYDKDGKRRNYVMYFMNGDLLMKQKYPFDAEGERGYDIRLHIKDDFLFNGRIHQTRFNIDTRESREVSFPVSKKILEKYQVDNSSKILVVNNMKKEKDAL